MCFEMKILLIFACLLSTYASGDMNQIFRADYRYIENIKSFFKIHMEHRSLSLAERICTYEGATLFYPKSVGDALGFVSALSSLKGSPSFNWFSNGISNLITETQNETLDGIPLSELYSNWEANENTEYPFICKKTEDSLEWNYDCNLAISGYTYNREQGRCYKFHQYPRNWTDSRDICNNEQSYLAVVNSPEEDQFLIELTNKKALNNVVIDSLHPFPMFWTLVHLGFHNMDKEGWKTIDGNKLEDSGYPHWAGNQPDGKLHELCGSMFYGGGLNDIGCDQFAFFICEHEINPVF